MTADSSGPAVAAAMAAAAALMPEAGAVALRYFRTRLAVESKGEAFDPVTEADRAIERLLRARLPQCCALPVIGEEYGGSAGADYWIVDPIDGTRAFLTGMLGWGILVGLVQAGAAVGGLLHQPYTGETFLADPRNGSRLLCAGAVRRLETSGRTDLSGAVLLSTHPDLITQAGLGPAYARLASRCRLQRYGGDCYAYAMLALGTVDLIVEGGLRAWDIAPLIPLVEQAGGIVTTLDGEAAVHGGTVVAAASRPLHAAALDILRERGVASA